VCVVVAANVEAPFWHSVYCESALVSHTDQQLYHARREGHSTHQVNGLLGLDTAVQPVYVTPPVFKLMTSLLQHNGWVLKAQLYWVPGGAIDRLDFRAVSTGVPSYSFLGGSGVKPLESRSALVAAALATEVKVINRQKSVVTRTQSCVRMSLENPSRIRKLAGNKDDGD